MKFSYRLKKVCGSVFSNGNLCFSSDGNTVISPVGNRVTVFDLVQQSCSTLPFENRKNIKLVAVSHNGLFLITVDVEGHALFINLPRQVILTRFNFKQKVYDIKFSPNDELIAVTFGNGCQIWRTPSIKRVFSPLVLSRTISGHHDNTTCLDWSEDSQSIIMGSKDLNVRVYYRVASKFMSVSVLSGHRDELVGVYYSKDADMAFTIARDGGIFTWKYEYGDRVPVKEAPRGGQQDEDTEEEDVSDSEEAVARHEKKQSAAEVAVAVARTKRTSHWQLAQREFLWEPHTEVASTDFNRATGLLVIGFTQGVFALYEMPGCTNLHRISASNNSLNSVSINKTGEWLAIGSARMGQLLVWEWQSESYVLKQQGHLYGLKTVDFSPDGQYIATGGEDSKVKLWNATSGFCFITFSEHIAPVTGVRFVGKGNGRAVVSCSLDGTVRAHDLLRYQNFRTMTTPTAVQFTSLAVDPSGEVVCAGAMDPFSIYVWSLQTGRLLDVLAGHEGPIACLEFSSTSMLASGSWDGTLKLWDVFKNTNVETFEHGCDVLAVAFRPDGKEVCCATTNGNISFWDVQEGAQVTVIEGRDDLTGGRLSTDAVSVTTAAKSKYFNSLCYTADGTCVLAGGRSKYACIYSINNGVLIKKFQLSHNRSLEGIADELRSDRLVDGVAIDSINVGDSDDEFNAYNTMPGGGKSSLNDGSRTTRPEVITSALRFSPTGRDWAVATTQGLQIFSLDDAMLFAPTDLDITITPEAVGKAIAREEFGLAINMALHLGERPLLKRAVNAVGIESIDLVVKSVDVRMLRDFLKFIADEVVSSPHIGYYLQWCWAVIVTHGAVLQSAVTSMSIMESLRALIRAISVHQKEVMRMSDENQFTLDFMLKQLRSTQGNAGNGGGSSSSSDEVLAVEDGSAQGTEVAALSAEVEVAVPEVHSTPDKQKKRRKSLAETASPTVAAEVTPTKAATPVKSATPAKETPVKAAESSSATPDKKKRRNSLSEEEEEGGTPAAEPVVTPKDKKGKRRASSIDSNASEDSAPVAAPVAAAQSPAKADRKKKRKAEEAAAAADEEEQDGAPVSKKVRAGATPNKAPPVVEATPQREPGGLRSALSTPATVTDSSAKVKKNITFGTDKVRYISPIRRK